MYFMIPSVLALHNAIYNFTSPTQLTITSSQYLLVRNLGGSGFVISVISLNVCSSS